MEGFAVRRLFWAIWRVEKSGILMGSQRRSGFLGVIPELLDLDV